jgi:hypothetical protein
MQPDPTSLPTKALLQKTVQANKEHQNALNAYTESLEKELATVDKLLVCLP